MQISHTYDPFIYANLPDFFQAKQFLSFSKELLEPIGEIFKTHRLNGRLGISLLHKHFNLLHDEILVRHVENNRIIIKPVRTGTIDVQPFVWAFAKRSIDSPYCLYPVEFIQQSDAPSWVQSVNTMLGSSDSFRAELFRALSKRGLTTFYGIGLTPRPLVNISQSETLMEEDNPTLRTLTLEVVSTSTIGSTSATQTLWTY
ncbi:hypothetical protein SJS42_04940 [Aeromonas caviae]|uniref:hypothetical protein n=1 Tax=Aeromonas caviae TaxID=648 RepID=UPI0029D87853|nr:hypothetical protein [Aeromonas caviae]MDX7797987.1 hypothetical protein [Aeromonas caviae]